MAEVEQLDKLEQYTEGDQADGELGELSQRFYQAAVLVSSNGTCVCVYVRIMLIVYKNANVIATASWNYRYHSFDTPVYTII